MYWLTLLFCFLASVMLPVHSIAALPKVPEGFIIKKVAAAPLVERPICADFDNAGRLYVADSSGSNEGVEVQLQNKPHRILCLEDKDGDGVFDKSVVFADKMMFPEGILWHDGAIYCGAPPSIWKLEDVNGDGRADRRSEWFQGKTLTGCANDLHGPYLGPDGMIYWCKGAFAKQTHERAGKKPVSDSAAHIFRCWPDGTGFDSFMAGGMDNPVEIAWGSSGDLFFTTTFYTRPRGGQRDAIVHGIYGSLYPKVNGVLDGLIHTGELMPAMTHLGPAAPCGLTRYESNSFGAGYQNNLFSCQFNMHKVGRHLLEPNGSTFKTSDFDFVVSDSPDFHPTDVIEDADGSLLVIDTGGWYMLCCPTSQIAKPEVLGGIYRVSRKEVPKPNDPRGLQLDWTVGPDQMVQRLAEKRPAIRKRAMSSLVKSGKLSVPSLAVVLSGSDDPNLRGNAVWALTQIDEPSARVATRKALTDKDPGVLQAAIHSAGVRLDNAALGSVINCLKNELPAIVRAAATTLGHLRRSEATVELLGAASRNPDRSIEHAIIFALIEINDPEKILTLLEGLDSPSALRAALISLDQIETIEAPKEYLVRSLSSDTKLLQETASWIYRLNPERGGELAGHLGKGLKEASNLSISNKNHLQSHLALFLQNPEVAQLMEAGLHVQNSTTAVRNLILNAITESKTKPGAWCVEGINAALKDKEQDITRTAINAVLAHEFKGDFDEALSLLASNESLPSATRVAAAVAQSTPKNPVSSELATLLFDALAANSPTLQIQRIRIAKLIGQSTFEDNYLTKLIQVLDNAGALEIPHLLPAFRVGGNAELGDKLIAALQQANYPTAPDELLLKFPESVRLSAAKLRRQRASNPAQQENRLAALEKSMSKGDVRRGHLLFNSNKAACLTCHVMGYRGGDLGPGLSRIGTIRNERDLLEAIVFPSVSLVRSYEPISVKTKSGKISYGLVTDQRESSITLSMGVGAKHLIPRDEISEMTPGKVSLMPAGYGELFSTQELADLIAFLKSMR